MSVYDIDRVAIEKSNGFDKYNVPLTPTTITKAGFFNESIGTVKEDNGKIQTVSGMIRFESPDRSLGLSDIYIIDGRRYNAVKISHPKDFTQGVTEVFLR